VAVSGSYWDGVLRRLPLAVPVALVAALLLFWLDDDLTATVLVGVVTAACVALVPTPRESVPPV
jgi:ABC-type bacteriocin/lantibiotic exporter with double-glycine peptidase domain